MTNHNHRTSIRILFTILFAAIPLIATNLPAQSQEPDQYWLELELVVDGFNQPVQVVDPGDGSGRLFVVEKPGVIRIIEDGEVLDEPFLDIAEQVYAVGFEQGLLGLAFHPDYQENGYFYITYSPAPHWGEWRLERFRASDDPNLADPASGEILLAVEHPGDTHYSGMITFGPDGYLWAGIGDGGGAFDPLGNAQNPGTLLGAILRLDVDGDFPYAIPPDNPFIEVQDARPEVWATGLRNPWRFSFDRETGDLYIGDVGESAREEINVVPAGAGGYPAGGSNFGWPLLEGAQCSEVHPDCDPAVFDPPAVAYTHAQGCSVTGGYVYRGDPLSAVYGTYIFADYCSGAIWTMDQDAGGNWQAEIRVDTGMNISSFGQDASGELYLTDLAGGSIYHLKATTDTPRPVLSELAPGAIPAGGVACTIDLEGWNFEPNALVTLNHEIREPEYVDSTHLKLDLNSDDLANAGEIAIAVTNRGPSPEETTSESVALELSGDQIGERAIYDRWARTDGPVSAGDISRTWMWGPEGLNCAFEEPYADAPGGTRAVQYFDKSRMEINNPDGDPETDWYVTNGLLVVEMVTGRLQAGDGAFEGRSPAEINVAGDFDDPGGPTYGTFSELLDEPALEPGRTIATRVNRSGIAGDDPALAERGVVAGLFVPETGHTVAAPFWAFMSGEARVREGGELVTEPMYSNPFYTTGFPITEAYWTTIRVAGAPRDVLVQLFERRVLTYTPDNPPGWQVEAGNAGRHYYFWRYGDLPWD